MDDLGAFRGSPICGNPDMGMASKFGSRFPPPGNPAESEEISRGNRLLSWAILLAVALSKIAQRYQQLD